MKIFLLIIIVFACSCQDSTCINTNPVLSSKTSASPEYQSELAKLVNGAGQENLTYNFDSYKKINDREFIVVDIKGKDFCGKMDFAVNDWTKIESLRKGGGYRGAELKGFRFDIVDNTEGKSFVYKDLDSILD